VTAGAQAWLFTLVGLAGIVGVVAVAGSAEKVHTAKTDYDTLCASCHGPGGKGDGPAGLTLSPMPRDFSVGEFKFDANSDGEPGTDADLMLVIRDGALAYGGHPLMAAWGHLGDERIAGLVGYIRGLRRDSS